MNLAQTSQLHHLEWALYPPCERCNILKIPSLALASIQGCHSRPTQKQDLPLLFSIRRKPVSWAHHDHGCWVEDEWPWGWGYFPQDNPGPSCPPVFLAQPAPTWALVSKSPSPVITLSTAHSNFGKACPALSSSACFSPVDQPLSFPVLSRILVNKMSPHKWIIQ